MAWRWATGLRGHPSLRPFSLGPSLPMHQATSRRKASATNIWQRASAGPLQTHLAYCIGISSRASEPSFSHSYSSLAARAFSACVIITLSLGAMPGSTGLLIGVRVTPSPIRGGEAKLAPTSSKCFGQCPHLLQGFLHCLPRCSSVASAI